MNYNILVIANIKLHYFANSKHELHYFAYSKHELQYFGNSKHEATTFFLICNSDYLCQKMLKISAAGSVILTTRGILFRFSLTGFPKTSNNSSICRNDSVTPEN